MAYTDVANKAILEAIAPFDVTIYDTVNCGDLLALDATNDGMCLADEDEPTIARAIAMGNGISGSVIKACLAAIVRTSSACAASTDIGSPLYLSATAGKMSLSAGGTTVQVVGAVLGTDLLFMAPGQVISDVNLTLSGALSVGTTLAVTGAATHSSTLAQNGVQTMATNVKLQFRDTGLYINSGADGKLTISSDGAGTDDITLSGTITLDDDLITPTTKKIQFRDTGLYINSGADGKLTISADGSGTDDITLSGTITLDDDLITPTNKKLQLRDTGIYLQSSADGKLLISSDGTGTDDITLSGTVTLDDDLITPTTKKIQFRDSGLYINSSADGKLVISADGVSTDDITLSGTVTLDDDLITPTTKKIQFRDSGLYINSSADGKLVISSDGAGTDDITLSGKVTLDDDLVQAADKLITVTTADKLKVGGIIVPQRIMVTSGTINNTAKNNTDRYFFICDRAYEIVSVELRASTIENSAADSTLMVEKVASATAIGSGVDVLTAAVNLKTGVTAGTNATLALHGTAANYTLADGDALALDFGGTAITEFDGVLTIQLKAV